MSFKVAGTIITTGVGSGLGASIAQQLLSASTTEANFIFTIRPSQNKSTPAYQAVEKAVSSNSSAEFQHLSLDDLTNVRTFAEGINNKISSGKLPKIQSLILNAGVQLIDGTHLSKDGFEAQFQVNYLSNFLLVLLLLPSFKPDARIIFVSSDSHDPDRAQGFYLQVWPEPLSKLWHPDPDTDKTNHRSTGMGRYALSKLCLVMYMYSLQRRLDESSTYSGITTVSVDPGWFHSNILRGDDFLSKWIIKPVLKAGPYIGRFIGNTQMTTADTSAKHVVETALQDWQGEDHKTWFLINGKKGDTSISSKNETRQEDLWKASLELLKLNSEQVPGLKL